MKLKELENTVVHLPTQEEYDEYMQMCEDAGWAWYNNTLPKENPIYDDYGCSTCVRVGDKFVFCSCEYYFKEGVKIITLDELKEMCGMKQWEPKNGEEILVWDGPYNEENPCKRTFVGMDGGRFVVKNGDGRSYSWRVYAKPIPKTYTVTIDGKDIVISEESFNALKKSLITGEEDK